MRAALRALPADASVAVDLSDCSLIDSVGIGANATLGGSNGVHVRYFVTPNVGLVLTLGLDTLDQSADGSGTERYDVTLDSAIYGQFRLLTWDRGAFGVQTGLDFGLGIFDQLFDAGGMDAPVLNHLGQRNTRHFAPHRIE